MYPAVLNDLMFAGYKLVPVEQDGPDRSWKLTHPTKPPVMVMASMTHRGLAFLTEKNPYQGQVTLQEFIGELDPAYLADKFLRWFPRKAQFYLSRTRLHKGLAASDGDGEAAEEIRFIDQQTGETMASAHVWRQQGSEYNWSPLAGYDELELATVLSVHNQFRKTFNAQFRLTDESIVPKVSS